jgi:hypothetical protein
VQRDTEIKLTPSFLLDFEWRSLNHLSRQSPRFVALFTSRWFLKRWVKFVCDLFDKICGDFCVVWPHGNEFDGPFPHGEAFAGGGEVLQDLLHGLFRLGLRGMGTDWVTNLMVRSTYSLVWGRE